MKRNNFQLSARISQEMNTWWRWPASSRPPLTTAKSAASYTRWIIRCTSFDPRDIRREATIWYDRSKALHYRNTEATQLGYRKALWDGRRGGASLQRVSSSRWKLITAIWSRKLHRPRYRRRERLQKGRQPSRNGDSIASAFVNNYFRKKLSTL